MEKKDKDIALFVAFCIEEYGAAKGMSGKQVLDLFSQYGVTDYLCNCFEPLHTQGRQWLVADIDEFIEINKKNKLCIIKGEPVRLTKTELELLVFFLSNPNCIYTRKEIISSIWGKSDEVTERAIDTNITRLRKKIGEYGSYLITRLGYGYGFQENSQK